MAHSLAPTRSPQTAPPYPTPGTEWALFLDVDGTLIGFQDDPDMVRVPDSLASTLARLHARLGGAVALISGRRLYDLDRLFGPPLVAAAGLHGLQRRRADGSEDATLPARAHVARMHELVAELSHPLAHVRIEDKGVCVALHYREAPNQGSAVIAAAERIAALVPGYETQAGNHVIEIKPAGMDKGRAVRAFLQEAPFRDRLPVYLGDDLTDEHAFVAINHCQGISVRVGRREPTQARFSLRDPAAVEQWLNQILDHQAGSLAH